MIMNYNKWFYNQHKYLKNQRDGIEGFNDTKWVNINKRYRILEQLQSEMDPEEINKHKGLLIHGNNTGFDKLIDIMGRSNYTFEDINDALIDTYRMSLQNAMGNNMVNTHAVMFHCNNMDKEHVTSESFTHYRIIDAPFNQLHFGHRDEFIRQKIQEMHNISKGNYVSITKFNSVEFTKILGFSIICTVNGYFCNDCMIAIDDKGFKFKIGWPYTSDVDFIVYKLNHSIMVSNKIPFTYVRSNFIPYSMLNNINKDSVIGMKCLINIYDDHYTKTTSSVPNFGVFEQSGLVIRNLQQTTVDMVTRLGSSDVMFDIYVLKYFHEIPGLYPAVNYYDFMDTRNVYDERYEYIKTANGHKIVSSITGDNNVNSLGLCTPPICIDRDMSYSFDIITRCLSMYDDMLSYEKDIQFIGKSLSENEEYFNKECRPRLSKIYSGLLSIFNTYQQGAITTSLISSELINVFDKLISDIKILTNISDFNDIQKYVINELYDSNYRMTVNKLTEPFRVEALQPFADMVNINNNFFDDHNSTRFNRPISEQCFISLRYHQDGKCWLFDYPDIKHFNGIGNTFYVNSNLNGNEIFKFFVLYTDTSDPVETTIDKLEMNTVYDFDMFSNELEKHIGMIRYWDAECRLMKLSKILYNKYDDETCVHVLSKILKRKLDGDHLIKICPSDINYEESNITSDNWASYDENSERGPFSINFMFYTLSLLNNNNDKLQSYFYRYLTHSKFDNRYADINISSVINSTKYPLNFSQFTISPSRIPDNTIKPDSSIYAYYGLPLILDGSGDNKYEPYRYVFNVYNSDIKYPLIGENDIDDSYYVQYYNIEDYAGQIISYHNIIAVGKLMTLYLTDVYNYISEIQTNYTTTYNSTSIIESAIKTINQHIDDINNEIIHNPIEMIDDNDTAHGVINSIISNNPFIITLNEMKSTIDKISVINYNSLDMSFITFINTHVLGNLKYVFVNFGFEDHIKDRVRMLYIHLKKINTSMNPYLYKKWLNDIDIHALIGLDDMISYNENNTFYTNKLFYTLGNVLSSYINTVINNIDILNEYIQSLSNDLKTNHILPIAQLCDNIIQNVIFDMYTLNQISYNSSIVYNVKPKFVVITISDSNHTKPPIGTSISGTHYLIFQPIIDKSDNGYIIKSISNICEYVFFNGEELVGLSMNVIGESGEVIGTQQVIMSFTRTCSTADQVNEFSLLPNSTTTPIDFENGHESFDVVNGLIVNEKHADMNYEMLIGNHFTQLNHEIEYVLEPNTWLQGSIDRLYIDNQMINRMIIADYGHNTCYNTYFKPVQVIHIPLNNDGSIDSINGKYFEGERIYLKTSDGLTSFPVVITKIDHSINKGFIEARIDDWNSKWFEIKDKSIISKYLMDDIQCEIIDDNMMNFLDEFSDTSLSTYTNIGRLNMNDHIIDLPGDPIFVTSNPEIMFKRLIWMFNESIPNRFIDDDHKKYRFNYIANGFILNENDEIKINMINHDFNNTTLPEKYPVLRDEPNDHSVWDQEIEVFKDKAHIAYINEQSFNRYLTQAEAMLTQATTYHDKEVALLEIDKWNKKIQRSKSYRERLERYTRQLESPTTWFNVRSYDAALVYISNGRADNFSPTFISNIRDLIYTNKVQVFLYDWQHRKWLDPKTYDMEIEMIDNIRIDECDDYTTNRVLHTLTIKPKEGFCYSKKILIYFAYNKSDIYNDIEMNNPTCFVKFKPLLSLCDKIDNYDPYHDIIIRKHFDGYEKYKVPSDDIYVKRVKRSGKYTYSPKFRICDISINDSNGTHDFNDIESFMIRSPFIDISTPRKFHIPKYTSIINSEIDSFQPGREIKLICISNNGDSSYDGNVSSIMFIGITSYDENNNQCVNINKSTLPNYVTGTFVCSVFQNSQYEPSGGMITITVDSVEEIIYDDWVKIPKSYMKYHEIPNEFKIVMKQQPVGDVEIILKNNYIKFIDDDVLPDNSNIWNPFEYYYDNKNFIKLPVSNVRLNSHNQRMTIDTSLNPNIQAIKSPYIGICRFSRNRIPVDGVIDLTGYIPTPLSRDRYEFWVNGRCVIDPNDITILSPTIIQLRNMKSLRNFEVIELVDDIDTNSELMKESTLYTDINGNTYSNYRLAMLSNSKIQHQDVMFTFNSNNNNQIHCYTKNISPNANNKDIEQDILSCISFDNTITDYEKMYNIPSINSVSLFHPKLHDLGISEIPQEKIINMFDKVWKFEEMTDPLFFTTHKSIKYKEELVLHVKQLSTSNWNGLPVDTNGMFVIRTTGTTEKFFSLYIAKKQDGQIDDVNNTVKIIPFISSGVYILIDKKYQGMWLHSTHENTKPIHIIK